jgi:hypothetical protein
MTADHSILISANLLFQCHQRSRFPLKKMNADDAETRDDRRLQYRDQRKSPFSVSSAFPLSIEEDER